MAVVEFVSYLPTIWSIIWLVKAR